MVSYEEKSTEEENDLIEVDVSDFEEQELEEVKKEEKADVDPETKEIESLLDEIAKLIEKGKAKNVLQKYSDLLNNLKEESKMKKEYLNTAQIVQADFENYKKRVHKDQEWSNFQNKQKIIQKFLTTYEDIERTTEMFNENTDIKSVQDALNLIHNNLKSVFESLEIKVINPLDDLFNPQFHEAVYVIDKEGAQNNQVVEVISKGFQLGNIVLKPARVVISKKSNKENQKAE